MSSRVIEATRRLLEKSEGALDALALAELARAAETLLQAVREAAPLVELAETSAAMATTPSLAPLDEGIPETVAPHLVGRARTFVRLREQLPLIAASDAPVLVLGENGTGKEGVAQAVYELSKRVDKPFLKVNCGALQDTLLESELFGHVRGAFTGAVAQKEGFFARANGGTLFLDELGDMTPSMQVKLLRVLQEGTFVPVGGTREMKVDVRIVAATNKDLPTLVKAGAFREDLYYRLNVIPIHLPPLRERRDDVPLLAQALLRRAMAKRGIPGVKRFTRRVMDVFARYPWPGNVRELENVVTRMLVFAGADGVLDTALIPVEYQPAEVVAQEGVGRPPAWGGSEPMRALDLSPGLEALLAVYEARIIREALDRSGDNMSAAARLLGITQPGIKKKMDRVGVRLK
jgi:transcriptional regulator with PAS, ATPase and Fis domain